MNLGKNETLFYEGDAYYELDLKRLIDSLVYISSSIVHKALES